MSNIIYIYHIPGKKIGVTKNLFKRVTKQQGYKPGEYEILGSSDDIEWISERIGALAIEDITRDIVWDLAEDYEKVIDEKQYYTGGADGIARCSKSEQSFVLDGCFI